MMDQWRRIVDGTNEEVGGEVGEMMGTNNRSVSGANGGVGGKLLGSFEERVRGTVEFVEQIEGSVENSKDFICGAVGGVGGTHAGVDGDVIRKFNDKKRNI